MRNVVRVILVVIISFFVLELALRAIGLEDLANSTFRFSSEPTMCFMRQDFLGVGLIPGEYEVTVNDSLSYTVTHTTDSTRRSNLKTESDAQNDNLFVFGCSYAYGWGVNDSATFAFQLSTQVPYKVYNYAGPGYGSVQAYIRLNQLISDNHIPKVVILCHADFHEERNLMLPKYGKQQFKGVDMFRLDASEINYPVMSLNKDTFSIESVSLADSYRPLIGANYSALMNTVDQIIVNSQSRSENELASTESVIISISKLCQSVNAHFIVAEVEKPTLKRSVRSICLEQSIDYLYIAPDFDKGGYRLLPYDRHPNERAHKHYANILIKYLDSIDDEEVN